MPARPYAKVVILPGGPSFEKFRQRLSSLAHPGVDVGLLQVGVHEAVVRPHLLDHLAARSGSPAFLVLRQAGADRVEWIDEADVEALHRLRLPEDLQPRPPQDPPPAGGPLWHLRAVRADAAWAVLGGPDAIDWGDVRIGQIDTGYTRHVAFGHGPDGDDRGSWVVAADSRTFLTPDARAAEFGLLPAPEPGGGRDPLHPGALNAGHGTRVGATISGWAHPPGREPFHGVAPRVPHVMVRMTDSVAISTRQDDFARALAYLVHEARVDVVNVSLGIFPAVPSPAVVQAMAEARAKGVIVVCAAGNWVDPVVAPACLPTAIAVGGVLWNGRPWSGSAYGPEVAFSAPAAGILRADTARGWGTGFSPGGDGTSYATGLTTGSAALWLVRWAPVIEAMYGRTARRVEAFRAAVQATCRKPQGWQPRPFGAGILDTGRLCTDLQAALPTVEGSFAMPPAPAPGRARGRLREPA